MSSPKFYPLSYRLDGIGSYIWNQGTGSTLTDDELHERNKKGDEENAPASPRFGTFAHTRPLFDLKATPSKRPYTQSQPESLPQDRIIRNRGPMKSGRRLLVRTDYVVYFSEREFVVEMPLGTGLRSREGSNSRSGSIAVSSTLSSSSTSASTVSSASAAIALHSGETKDGNNSPDRNGNTNKRGENIVMDQQGKGSSSTEENLIYKGGSRRVNSTSFSGTLNNGGNSGGDTGRNTRMRIRRALYAESGAEEVYNTADGHAHRHHGRNESKESREIRRERHKQRDLQWGRNRTDSRDKTRDKYRDRDGSRDQDKMRDREREIYRGGARERYGHSDSLLDRSSIPLPQRDRLGSRGAIRAEEGRQAGEGEYTTIELPLSLSAVMHYRYCCANS